MKVYEFEAKKILADYQIDTPAQLNFFASKDDISKNLEYPVIAKVLILSGKRGKRGGVKEINSFEELVSFYDEASAVFASEKPLGILTEKMAPAGEDIYFSISYNKTGPILVINQSGGVDIEASKLASVKIPIDPLTKKITSKPAVISRFKLKGFTDKVLKCFFEQDCELLEINPLRIGQDRAICLDVKMILDDRAGFRHRERQLTKTNKNLTERELVMAEINSNPDFKGSPCRYVELDGDVALLLSGGGASLIIFDALVNGGAKPGNYSEYSGNPTKEKVEALTRIILSKPNQKGLLIAGGIANFTLIDETMAGIAKALADVKPNYPIVIRRGGPNEKIGKKIIMDTAVKHNLDITWLSSDKSLKEACQYFIEKLK